MLKSMETWVVISIVIGAVLLYVITRPRQVPSVWYDIMPRVYDRIPSIIRDSGGWGGRGAHRGEREIPGGAFRGL